MQFTLRADPDTVEGQQIPIVIDTVAFIADPDTLGGEYTDSAATNACFFSGFPRRCTRTINGAGRLRVVAYVNGKRHEVEKHIARSDPYPILTPTKYFVASGQRDTFTVRMSDNSAFTMYQWWWTPLTGQAQTTIGCSNSQNPCPNTIVRETGTMRAKVVHGGRFKYARAKVTTGPRPRLQLAANKTLVLAGEPILFSTAVAGAPYSISSWRYHTTSVGCGTAKLCDYAPPFGASMTVRGTVDGAPDSASVAIRVTVDTLGKGYGGLPLDTTVSAVLSVLNEGGVTVNPNPGEHVFPLGSSIAYSVSPLSGYSEPATIAADTLAANSGSIQMTTSRRLEVGADWNWAANLDVALYRSRLRALITNPSPSKFAQHLVWYSDTLIPSAPSVDSVEHLMRIAELLEIDVFADRAALLNYDNTLGGHSFRYFRRPGADSVQILTPNDYPPLMLTRALSRAGESVAASMAPPPAIIYVNGVRTAELDIVQTGTGTLRRLDDLIREDSILSQAIPTYLYNRNFAAHLAAFDSISGCGGLGIRARGVLRFVTSFATYARCQVLRTNIAVTQDDFVESAEQFAGIVSGITVNPVAEAGTLAARMLKYHHDSGSATILLTHSQGNMLASQAYSILGGVMEYPWNQCVAHVALASPIARGDYGPLPSTKVQGMIIQDDFLLSLNRNNFAPLFDSDAWHRATARINSAPAWRRDHELLRRSFEVHGINENYFVDVSNRGVMRGILRNAVSGCLAP